MTNAVKRAGFTVSYYANNERISDFDEKKYLVIMVSAKAFMILLLAFFGQSVVKAFENPAFIILALILVIVLYIISKKVSKDHNL